MTFDIAGFKLTSVQFDGRRYYAAIRGKDKYEIEAEFRIPLAFRFRRDRSKEPTLEEIAEAAKSSLFKLSYRIAVTLDKDKVIQQAKYLAAKKT